MAWQRTARHVVVLAVVGVLAGCGASGDPDLVVGRAQAAEPVAGASQIVVDVTNRGDGGDRLVGAETSSAVGVEIHLTEIDDGRATMGELDQVDIPAGQTVRFRPGGLHLMMVVPDDTVRVGATFQLTLHFDRSGDVTVPVEVVDLLDLAEQTFEDPDAADEDDT